MASIRIVKTHHLNHKKAREVAEAVARDLEKKYNLAYKWDGDNIVFGRSGVSGRLHVAKERFELRAELGFLLAMFKPAIEHEIHSEFDRLVPPSTKKKA
jgi:putative polyhydroxyalkanoate system protein